MQFIQLIHLIKIGKYTFLCNCTKTAEIVKNLKGNLAFTGITSHGNEFAIELIPLLKTKKFYI